MSDDDNNVNNCKYFVQLNHKEQWDGPRFCWVANQTAVATFINSALGELQPEDRGDVDILVIQGRQVPCEVKRDAMVVNLDGMKHLVGED